MPIAPRENVPLAPLTTLELGGPARFLVTATAHGELDEALEFARARGLPAFVLGGGSNLIVPDAGYPGLVVRVATRGIAFTDDRLTVAAGEPWDGVVAACVTRGLGGLECLSGIPGTAGATPVQNVGAYGQEVSETITAVHVLDRATGATVVMDNESCGFAYRTSRFKRAGDAFQDGFVVRAVEFALHAGAAPSLRYAELRAALPGSPSLADARAAVLALRRRKSMVIDPGDGNRRSVGSFFTNPVVSEALADAVAARAATPPPRFAAGPGEVKLPAAWLIEQAGFRKGERRGAVGLSSAHALALVHHGGGRTADLLAFAREIRGRVAERFGVTLVPEPVVLGAAGDPLA